MYKAFFGLMSNPFNLSPDPAFLYRSPQHEEALANLIYGVQSRKGFILLTGEVGTGKTTMLECLRDHLTSHHTPFGFIFNSRLTPEQFFEMMAYDFDLRCTRTSKTEVLFALNQMLLERANRGYTTALIIDEAQNLTWDVLEENRLLGNLENRRGKMMQIILSGQPELDVKLSDPSFRQLKQRIALRCHLRPFNEAETGQYIASRLAARGHEGADRLSARRAEGNPPPHPGHSARASIPSATTCCSRAFAMASKHATARHDRRGVARPAPRLPRQQPDLDRRGYQRYPGTPVVSYRAATRTSPLGMPGA